MGKSKKAMQRRRFRDLGLSKEFISYCVEERQELIDLRKKFYELDKRKQRQDFPRDSYDYAMWITYKECLACLESKDPSQYEYNEEAIKRAGHILYELQATHWHDYSPETGNMRDSLFWAFIPRSERRVVEALWDGIGGWKG